MLNLLLNCNQNSITTCTFISREILQAIKLCLNLYFECRVVGTTPCVPQEKSVSPYNKSCIGQACSVKMTGHGLVFFFFACLWIETESRSINTQGKNIANMQLYYMASSVSGQDESNSALRLATRADKMELPCPLGTTHLVPQEKNSPKAI